jgi:hypothetical protein
MIRQYYAQRCQGGDNPLRVGVVSIGSIYYIQSDRWWRDRYRGRPDRKNPWIVEGFFNGVMTAAVRDPLTGYWESRYIAGRSDTALIRSLREGRRRRIPIRALILHDDEGLTKGMTGYPDRPRLPFRQPKPFPSTKDTRLCLALTPA